MNLLLHLIFIATFVFLFVVSIIILKPFRIHRKRTVSTIALKVSYLIYLFSFLILAYLVLFYSGARSDSKEPISKDPYLLYYIAVILAFFIPNLGITFRRKFDKYRNQYNYIFTLINLFTIVVLAFIMYSISWEF